MPLLTLIRPTLAATLAGFGFTVLLAANFAPRPALSADLGSEGTRTKAPLQAVSLTGKPDCSILYDTVECGYEVITENGAVSSRSFIDRVPDGQRPDLMTRWELTDACRTGAEQKAAEEFQKPVRVVRVKVDSRYWEPDPACKTDPSHSLSAVSFKHIRG